VVKLQIGHIGTETSYPTSIWDFSLLRRVQAGTGLGWASCYMYTGSKASRPWRWQPVFI